MNWNKLFTNTGKSDLQKVKSIYETLNLDTSTIKIISVVGTNGKGSVSNYISQGLISNNQRVGLFTSPHMINPQERIKINDVEINDCEVDKILLAHPELNGLVFFSTMFLMAMIYFVKNKVDVIILEAGVGGLKDSTNAVEADYGVVTSIGLDHQDFLGNTTIEIAKDKSGIINESMTFFIPTNLKKEIQDIFVNKATSTKVATYKLVDNKSKSYSARNKLLAQSVLKSAFNIDIDLDFFKPIPGRTEVHDHGSYKYIYDVGHNYDGLLAAYDEIKLLGIDIKNVVISLQRKKDKTNVKEIFNDAKVYCHQLDDNYYSATELGAQEVKNISEFDPQSNTLFIGSFYFISKLWKK